MVEIAGFRALRYVPTAVGSLAQVVAPPYDVISPADLQRLWERNPYNVVRLILPAGDLPPAQRAQGYRLAATRWQAWKRAGALAPDEQPSLYLYRQQFRLPGGEARMRQGFFALARLTEWGEGVYRHELTLPGPVADRIRLLAACRANLSSIFGLYSDPQHEIITTLEEQVGGQAPAIEVVDDRNIWHGLWPVADPVALRQVTDLLQNRSLVVADGHHRYTAALEYRARMRRANPTLTGPAPWDYALFYLDALEDPGLVILPTHQVLQHLPGFAPERFVEQMQGALTVHEEPALAALLERLDSLAADPAVALGAVVEGGRYYLLRATRPQARVPEEALDVALLRRHAVEPLLRQYGAGDDLERHLCYTHQAHEAAAWVSMGQANVAFILRPTSLAEVRSVALAHRVMPQKSTYFYPKVLSGLVFYDHTH